MKEILLSKLLIRINDGKYFLTYRVKLLIKNTMISEREWSQYCTRAVTRDLIVEGLLC